MSKPEWQDPEKFKEVGLRFGGNFTLMAEHWGVDNTTVSKWKRKLKLDTTDFTPAPSSRAAGFKALMLDIETSPNEADLWRLWGDQHVSLDQLRESSRMLCFSAKWLGKRGAIFHSEFHDSREVMLEQAFSLINEADALIHYNGNRFDVPALNREFLLAGYTPPQPSKNIDLYKVVKKHFQLPSYKLDYVAQILEVGKKAKHEGHSLWTKCMNGDEAAWGRMKRYNIRDTLLLEGVYHKLLPWITNHPNRAIYEYTEGMSCPNCGHKKLAKQDYAFTGTSVYEQYQCEKCGTWAKENKRVGGSTISQTKF